MDRGSTHYTGDDGQTPKKKKCKKPKWLSEEAFQIAERRKEVKGKGERKRYTQLNVESQRIARNNRKIILQKKKNSAKK